MALCYYWANREGDSLNKTMLLWQHHYFTEDPSVLGLFLYYEILTNPNGLNKTDLTPLHKFWKDQYPENSLTPVAIKTYNAFELSKFQNIDLLLANSQEGDLASVVMASEYTLLDLWSPWCGPCLRKSKQLENAYPELKSRGLTILGVMGGISDKKNYLNNLKKHNYPWKVYREINNEQSVWHRYGIAYSGGKQFLINTAGEIIATNPTVEELLQLLNK